LTSIKIMPGGGCQALSNLPTVKEPLMLDVIMLAIGVGFFAVALAYVAACERL
jgi:hypothetical protein